MCSSYGIIGVETCLIVGANYHSTKTTCVALSVACLAGPGPGYVTKSPQVITKCIHVEHGLMESQGFVL